MENELLVWLLHVQHLSCSHKKLLVFYAPEFEALAGLLDLLGNLLLP